MQTFIPTIKYFNSFIFLPENEIKSPTDSTFFFSKAYINKDGFIFLTEGYRIMSENDYRLSMVVHHVANEAELDNQKHIITTHTKKYPRIRFYVRNIQKINDNFVLTEYEYDKKAVFLRLSKLYGKKEWYWEEEELFDQHGKCIHYTETVYGDNDDIIKELLYDKRGGKLLNIEYYED